MDETTLEVFLGGVPVGVLTKGRKAGSATFTYNPEATTPLSVSLPLRPDPFDPVLTRNWFTGLLPEGDRLEMLARHFGVPTVDYVDLLREIGHECAGAVSFGAPLYTPENTLTVDAADVVPELPAVHADARDGALRSIVAGVQPKITALDTGGGEWIIPADGSPTTHILKPDNPHWKGIADAEAWAMTIAGQAATAAGTTVAEFGGVRTLVSERFDRTVYDGTVRALHQEDYCQSLGLNAERKYAVPGGNWRTSPSLLRLAELLSLRSTEPERDLEELVRHLTVNVLLGNTDWHAKNVGLLHEEGGSLRLAPLYDVVPVTHFLPKDAKMAMSVNSKFRLDRMYYRDLVSEAEMWGFEAAHAEKLVSSAVVMIRAGIDAAEELHPERPEGVLSLLHAQLRRFGEER